MPILAKGRDRLDPNTTYVKLDSNTTYVKKGSVTPFDSLGWLLSTEKRAISSIGYSSVESFLSMTKGEVQDLIFSRCNLTLPVFFYEKHGAIKERKELVDSFLMHVLKKTL